MSILKALTVVMAGLLSLALILVVRTLTSGPTALSLAECTPADPDYLPASPAVVGRFRAGLRLRTVSWDRGQQNFEELVKIRHFIKEKALEFLLKQGTVPKRSFYVAFGHDEEVLGHEGAEQMAHLLKSRQVTMAFILDEGLTVMNGFIPGIKSPIAAIGTSEKGYLTVRLSVDVPGGHSSMPSRESCIGILGKAITRLEENPHPSRFGTGPEKAMFEYIADKFPFPLRMVMSNLWLFGPLVSQFMSRKPSTNAFIRTTTAVTRIEAGVKDNVIAQHAWAIVNHRIHPADSVKQVLEYDRSLIADERVKMEVVTAQEPLPLSPFGDGVFGFEVVRASIHQVWLHHNVSVAPGLMIGGTDTKHYVNLTDQIYRFSPTYMFPEDAKRFHGINERISVENYQDAVNFYYHVITNADKAGVSKPHTHTAEL